MTFLDKYKELKKLAEETGDDTELEAFINSPVTREEYEEAMAWLEGQHRESDS